MRNLYQRDNTVQFPYPGPTLYDSFYATPLQPDATQDDIERAAIPVGDVELRSHWARVYASVLTNGHRHTVAMASVLGHYHVMLTGLYERLTAEEREQRVAGNLNTCHVWAENGEHVEKIRRGDTSEFPPLPVKERLRELGRDAVAVVGNGFRPGLEEVFSPRPLARGEVTAGYFGYLAGAWFDWALLAAAARQRPDWRFYLIGYGGSPAEITLPENVVLLGKQAQRNDDIIFERGAVLPHLGAVASISRDGTLLVDSEYSWMIGESREIDGR